MSSSSQTLQDSSGRISFTTKNDQMMNEMIKTVSALAGSGVSMQIIVCLLGF